MSLCTPKCFLIKKRLPLLLTWCKIPPPPDYLNTDSPTLPQPPPPPPLREFNCIQGLSGCPAVQVSRVHCKIHPSSLPRLGSNISPGCARCHWGATLVTGVHWVDHEIVWDMQNLVGMEISELEFDWRALEAYEKNW